MTAAAVSYAAELATPSTLATLQGLHNGIYHGVGEFASPLMDTKDYYRPNKLRKITAFLI